MFHFPVTEETKILDSLCLTTSFDLLLATRVQRK